MKIIEHKGKERLEDELCSKIVSVLNIAIKKTGFANMLVSGGSTPKNLFQKLSKEKIDWKNVFVGLVDDRFVAYESDKSNDRLIKENLIRNEAKDAKFLGLVYEIESRSLNLKIATKVYNQFNSKVDVCLLGMGGDGHTASLFPTDEDSKKGLSNDYKDLLINTQADVEPTERISCSRFLINKSEHLFLMITGENKKEVLLQAKESKLPIATFFETPKTELIVHYSKN